jgi:hypothetical protein
MPFYDSTEGIYEGVSRSWRDSYVTGFANEVNWQSVQDIRQGLRQEYTPELGGQPWLYFSPVDRRLHLLNAQGGVWHVNEDQRVRYENLNGDGYIDRWTFTEQPASDSQEQPLKVLQVIDDMLIYSDDLQVHIVRSQVEPSLFETLPPNNHQEWLALGELLDRYSAQLGPDSFLGMLAQFDGPVTRVEAATLGDFRLIEGGFRFLLELEPDFVVREDANDLGLQDLEPGAYVFEYKESFGSRPATPPRLSLPEGAISVDPAPPTQMAWTTIQAVLYNSGLRDVASLPVQIYAAHGDSEPVLEGEYDLFLPGEGQATLVHDWMPVEPGEWRISIEIDRETVQQHNIELGPMTQLDLYVQPGRDADLFLPSTAYDVPSFSWPVAIFWASVTLVAAVILLLLLRYSRSSRSDIHASRLAMTDAEQVAKGKGD